jgi:hypothetical protein
MPASAVVEGRTQDDAVVSATMSMKWCQGVYYSTTTTTTMRTWRMPPGGQGGWIK